MKTFARPSNPLHEWVLEEGSASRFARRCQEWKWKSRDCLGLEDENPVSVSTWMQLRKFFLIMLMRVSIIQGQTTWH